MMKKFTVVVLLAVGGLALASSLNVPWFVDNATPGAFASGSFGMMGFVSVHNNSDDPVECMIEFFAPDGTYLDYDEGAEEELYGPDAATAADRRQFVWKEGGPGVGYNTFMIGANATVAFRPVMYDPAAEATIDEVAVDGVRAEDGDDRLSDGQEGDAGVVVPNRPRYGEVNSATWQTNGSCKITWADSDPNLVQGRYLQLTVGLGNDFSDSAYLLPSGG